LIAAASAVPLANGMRFGRHSTCRVTRHTRECIKWPRIHRSQRTRAHRLLHVPLWHSLARPGPLQPPHRDGGHDSTASPSACERDATRTPPA
jgi:hypothetical protein